ncbi:hypothetical protein HY251_14470 [bacterium]|nr:hypothetical protein [bacterium]
MKKLEDTKQIALRLPVGLLARLESWVAHVRKKHPGVGFTRADLIRTRLYESSDEKEAALKKEAGR